MNIAKISKEEWDLLQEFASGNILEKDYQSKWTYKRSFFEFKEILISAIINDSTEYNSKFHAVFWYLPVEQSNLQKSELYREFLLMNGHNEHEEIVGVFQVFFNDDRKNIFVLLTAIEQIPKYLNYGDLKYPYIRKIIYAIGAQPEPYNIEALEKIINETEDETIKELALHQVEKRKKLGRWEFEKNKAHGNT